MYTLSQHICVCLLVCLCACLCLLQYNFARQISCFCVLLSCDLGVAIGGDRYPGSTFLDHMLRYEVCTPMMTSMAFFPLNSIATITLVLFVRYSVVCVYAYPPVYVCA